MSQCHMCIGLVQMEAERDAQAAQARRVVTELQTVTVERDRLLSIVSRLVGLDEDGRWTEPNVAADTWNVYESVVCWECNGGDELARVEPMDQVDADLIRQALGLDDGDGDR